MYFYLTAFVFLGFIYPVDVLHSLSATVIVYLCICNSKTRKKKLFCVLLLPLNQHYSNRILATHLICLNILEWRRLNRVEHHFTLRKQSRLNEVGCENVINKGIGPAS